MLGDVLVSARQALGGAGNSRASTRSRDPFATNGNGVGAKDRSALATLLPKLPSSSSTAAAAAANHAGPDGPAPSWAALLPSSSTVGFISLCCLWYLSSAFSSNTGKSILTRFRYPVTLTFVQFAFVAGYCVLILALRERIGNAASHHQQHHPINPNGTGNGGMSNRRRRSSISTLGGWGIRKPSKHMFHGTFMMSLFQIAGHVFSSMAIARVPVSTVHTIKALSPLFTVLSYAALFGVRYSSATYVALLPLTIGVMLACSFDLRANAMGFLCALGSTFIFVAQNIFSKKLLPKENSSSIARGELKAGTGAGAGSGGGGAAKLDKLNLLFYSSGMAFFLMIPIWLYSDASALFFSVPAPTQQAAAAASAGSTSSLLFYFFANGSVHFAQNLLAFSILARTSPVTYSIASLIKRIAVICIAIVWSRQHVSLIQAVGMTSTFGGLWMYNRAKSDVDKGEKKRVQVEKRHDLELPSTVGDARALDGTDTPPPQTPMMGQQYYGRREVNGSAYAQGAAGASGPDGLAGPNAFTSSTAHHPAAAPPPPRTHHAAPVHPSSTVYSLLDPFDKADPYSRTGQLPAHSTSPLGGTSSSSASLTSSPYPSNAHSESSAPEGQSASFATAGEPLSPRPNASSQARDGAVAIRAGYAGDAARNGRGSSSRSRSRAGASSPGAKSVGPAAGDYRPQPGPGQHPPASARGGAASVPTSSPAQLYSSANGNAYGPGRIMPPESLFAPIAAGGASATSGGYR